VKEKNVPLSLRISRELDERLRKCAEQVKQKKHTLAQLAIEAAIEAIEESDRLVIPMKFQVTHVAKAKKADANPEPNPGPAQAPRVDWHTKNENKPQ